MAGPLATFRKHQKKMLVFFGVLLMIAFIILPIISQYTGRSSGARSEQQVVVQLKSGQLQESDIQGLRAARMQLLRFLARVQQIAQQRGANPWVVNLVSSDMSDRSLVQSYLVADHSRKAGVIISDEAIIEMLMRMSDKVISREELFDILQETTRRRMAHQQFFNAMRRELLATEFAKLFHRGIFGLTPLGAWDYYQRINRFVELELMEIDVQKFLPQAEEPSEEQIRALYEERKDDYPHPASQEPGFKRRKKVAIEVVKADLRPLLEIEKRGVTDEQVRQFYEQNKEQYRATELPGAGTSGPTRGAGPNTNSLDLQLPAAPPANSPAPAPGTSGIPSPDGIQIPNLPDAADAPPSALDAGLPTSPPPPSQPGADQQHGLSDLPPSSESPDKDRVDGIPQDSAQQSDELRDEPSSGSSPPQEPDAESPPDASSADPATGPSDQLGAQGPSTWPHHASERSVASAAAGSGDPRRAGSGDPRRALAPDAAGATPVPVRLVAFQDDEDRSEAPADASTPADETPSNTATGDPPKPPAPQPEPQPSDEPGPADPSADTQSAEPPQDRQPETPSAAVPSQTAAPAPADDRAPHQSPQQPNIETDLPDVPAQVPTEPKYRPLQEVADDIRTRIASSSAQQQMNKRLGQVREVMQKYFGDYVLWNATPADERNATPPPPPDLASETAKHGLEYQFIPLSDAVEIHQRDPLTNQPRYEISQAYNLVTTEDGQMLPHYFVDMAFDEALREYEVHDVAGQQLDTTFLFWKTDQKEGYVPALDECRSEVVRAIKIKQAYRLAHQAAEKKVQQLRQTGKSLKESVDQQSDKVIETGQFTWMTREDPRPSNVPGVEFAGDAFMRDVMSLRPGQYGVATNQPHTKVYVVWMKSQTPDDQQLRQEFLADGQRVYRELHLLHLVFLRDLFSQWYENYTKELGVEWKRDPIVARR